MKLQKEILCLDDILVKFSVYKQYHLKNILLVIVATIFSTIHTANYIFAAEEVAYRCINYNNLTKDCIEWIYDNPDSFVAEFQLANQEWKRTLVGTVHSFGYMVGLLIIGPLSDRCGRKAMITVTCVLGGVIGLVKSFSTWYWLYIALEFLESCLGDSYSPCFIFLTEIISMKYRIKYIFISHYGQVIGGLIVPLMAYLTSYWRTFLRVAYGPALLFVCYTCLIEESPRWLLIKGRKEEAIEILKKAASMNKLEFEKNDFENLTCEDCKKPSFMDTIKYTFRSKLLRRRFLVCLIWWTTCTFVHYGLKINLVSLKGNKYLNYTFIYFAEIPGIIIILNILIKYKRKLPLMGSFFAAAVLCISQPFIPKELPWASITFYVLGMLMARFFFSITYLYTSELFPTYTRNSMHALCSSIGRVGSIIAPQTPLLIPYWSGLPSFICGIVSLFAALMTLLVPDISDDSLPDTVKEAEDLGKANKENKIIHTVPEKVDITRL